MKIIKNNGKSQDFSPNKIMQRIKTHAKGLSVNSDNIFKAVIPSIQDSMTTTELDELLSLKIAEFIQDHPDYSTLASRILITRQGKLIGKEPMDVDLDYDYFGTVTFLTKYSLKDDSGRPIELPSCMYKRVGYYFGIDEEEKELFTKELMSKRISVATPILTNADTVREAYISCNITTLIEDSTEGILETLDNISKASREGAGIGLSIDALRSKMSMVSSFKGSAGGVVRFADMVQSHMRFFKQGTRAGSAALYLSVWHKDILDFLNLKLPIGDEKLRARDLFTAVIINDNFMNALINETEWYLFCPNEIKLAGLRPLQDLWGSDYETEYNKAIELGIGEKVNPKTIWDAIIKSCAESGTPYVMFKDNANRINMQDNIGTIKSFNLCAEFAGVSKPGYTSQCDLGLINLTVHDGLDSITESTRILTRLLNRVIDKNKWQDKPSELAGEDQRSIGIGVAGLADFFAIKDLSFTSEEARQWNIGIFETIHKSAVIQSNELAEIEGNYPAWEGSRYQKGLTYIEGWSPKEQGEPIKMRNSLISVVLPSASTSILLSSNECTEPFGANIQVRNTGSGEFLLINKYLVKDLEKIGLWNDFVKKELIQNEGSVQSLPFTDHLREKYKSVWEISQRDIIQMAADRQRFIDQSQSMNLYFEGGTYGKISGALKYGWEQGLKTGVYYTKTEKKTSKPTRLTQMDSTEKPQTDFECFGCSS